MKRFSISIFLFLFCGVLNLYSQRIDNVWPIGYDCCGFTYFGAMNLTFTGATMNLSSVQRHQNLSETVGSACDSANNLLFTTNGVYVANASDDTMQNGSGLNPSYYTSQNLRDGLTLPQGNLVLPSLTDSNQFILFHNTIDDYLNTGASFKLYSSTIDMNQNSGLGAVVNKNTVLYTDSITPGRIIACRHANGRDWWILVHRIRNKDAVEFLYTPQGISSGVRKSLTVNREFYTGQCAFNPQGTKYVYFEKTLGLEVGDFDRCTGDITNIIYCELPDSSVIGGGAAFSPNGRFLYVCSVDHLYQYDTWASNLDSSRVLIDVYDNFIDTVTSNVTHFWLEALGPDGKIYISATNSVPYLHVINYPDSLGTACGFCQHCISLPYLNAFTMPNFPNYTLGAEAGSVCDSLGVGIHEVKSEMEFNIYPNPATEKVNFHYSKLSSKAILLIYNLTGEVVSTYLLKRNESEIEVDVSSLINGVYICKLMNGNSSEVKQLVIIK